MKLRSRQSRLSAVETGCRTGDCFLAALLAQTQGLDFSKFRIDQSAIDELRKLDGVPQGRTYLDGRAQQRVAAYLHTNYIIVDDSASNAALYRIEGSKWYALLKQSGIRHILPIATQGGERCGLVEEEEAVALLASWGVTLASRGGPGVARSDPVVLE